MKRKADSPTVLFSVLLALLIALFSGTACDFAPPAQVTPSPAQPTPEATQPPPAPEQQEANGEAEESVESEVATQIPAVKAEALVNLNLRQGPSTSYPVVSSLPEASEIAIVGRNEDGTWLVGQTETGEEVWLSGDPTLVQVSTSQVSDLPVASDPPPPFNSNIEQVNNVLNLVPLVVHHQQNITCASHAGLNNLLPEVVAGNVLGPHAGDFVYKGDNVLFRYENGTFLLIKENPTARFENGEEFLPLATAMQYFESGDLVWNGNFGDTGRGVTGCDKSTP